MQVSEEEARATIDHEMKTRGLDYVLQNQCPYWVEPAGICKEVWYVCQLWCTCMHFTFYIHCLCSGFECVSKQFFPPTMCIIHACCAQLQSFQGVMHRAFKFQLKVSPLRGMNLLENQECAVFVE